MFIYSAFVALVWLYFAFFYNLDTFSQSRYGAYSHAYYFTTLTFPWLFLWCWLKSQKTVNITDWIESRWKRRWVQSLKTSIVEIAEDAGIDESEIYEVNMSEKTSSFNAYVTGLGNQKRIVLWDTTLNGMKQGEVLFILAHEVAHYVKHHVYLGVFGYIALSFVVLWILAKVFSVVYQNTRHRLGLQNPLDLRSIPVLLLLGSILLFVTQPISLYVSREMERSADRYAIEHTDDLEPALESYRSLAVQSKSDISPSPWIVWLRYTHPPIEERMDRIRMNLKNE